MFTFTIRVNEDDLTFKMPTRSGYIYLVTPTNTPGRTRTRQLGINGQFSDPRTREWGLLRSEPTERAFRMACRQWVANREEKEAGKA